MLFRGDKVVKAIGACSTKRKQSLKSASHSSARAHDGCLPARLGVQDRLVLAGTEIGSMIRPSSAILSKGYGFFSHF